MYSTIFRLVMVITLTSTFFYGVYYILNYQNRINDKFRNCHADIILQFTQQGNGDVISSFALVIDKQRTDYSRSTYSGHIEYNTSFTDRTKKDFYFDTFSSVYTEGDRFDVKSQKTVINTGTSASLEELIKYVTITAKKNTETTYNSFLISPDTVAFGESTFPRVICNYAH